MTALREGVHAAAKRADAAVAAAAKAAKWPASAAAAHPPTPCLAEMQREIDDLQAYLAYRTPLHSDRVSGGCASLLAPRYQGSSPREGDRRAHGAAHGRLSEETTTDEGGTG